MTPGSSCIETPAIPLEIGSCSTVASLPKLFPKFFPLDFSSSNLKLGNSFPDSSKSGTLFWKLMSPITGLLARSMRGNQANHAFAGRSANGDWQSSSFQCGIESGGARLAFQDASGDASSLNSARRQTGTPQTDPAPASRQS